MSLAQVAASAHFSFVEGWSAAGLLSDPEDGQFQGRRPEVAEPGVRRPTNHSARVMAKIANCRARNPLQLHWKGFPLTWEICLYQITTAAGPPTAKFLIVYPKKITQYAISNQIRPRRTSRKMLLKRLIAAAIDAAMRARPRGSLELEVRRAYLLHIRNFAAQEYHLHVLVVVDRLGSQVHNLVRLPHRRLHLVGGHSLVDARRFRWRWCLRSWLLRGCRLLTSLIPALLLISALLPTVALLRIVSVDREQCPDRIFDLPRTRRR